MMDGRTAHIRAALDGAGHGRVPIMSYSTKFASQFYGPFRAAAGSAPQFGDRRHYQIDVRSRRDAIESSVRCADEGADLLMVKPALTSLDLIGPIGEDDRDAGRRVSGERRVSPAWLRWPNAASPISICALPKRWHVLRRAGAATSSPTARDARGPRLA